MTAYTFTAFMHYDVRPNDVWTSTHEYDIAGAISGSSVLDTANDIANALAGTLLDNVIVDRITVSTWVPDSRPYDPTTVRVIPQNVPGVVDFIGPPVDDDLTLFIRKTAENGRTGKMFLRGALASAFVTATAGSWVLEDAVQSDFEDQVLALFNGLSNTNSPSLIGKSLTETIYHAAAEGEVQEVEKKYDGPLVIRQINDFVLAGLNERQDTQ